MRTNVVVQPTEGLLVTRGGVVFVIACSTCHRRQLIFPTQVVQVDGALVTYRCWCGSEQVWTPGTGQARAA